MDPLLLMTHDDVLLFRVSECVRGLYLGLLVDRIHGDRDEAPWRCPSFVVLDKDDRRPKGIIPCPLVERLAGAGLMHIRVTVVHR